MAAVCLAVLTSCTGEAPADLPSATVPTAPATTTTTNPYAVPDIIDIAYLNRVLAWFDQAKGDILRSTMSSRSLAPEDVARLRALHLSDVSFQGALDVLQYDLRAGFVGLYPTPGNKHTTVVEILSSSTTCAFARVYRDASAVSMSENPRFRTQWVALRRLDQGSAPNQNATGWAYEYNGARFQLGGGDTVPKPPEPNPCASF